MAETTPTGATPLEAAAKAPSVPDSIVEKDGAWYMKGIVDKKEVLLPINEVQTRLQKDIASEQRFAEASAKEAAAARESAENATSKKFWELANRGEAGDRAAAAEALRMLGKNPDDYMEQPAGGNAPRQSAHVAAQPSELPADVREAVNLLAAARNEGIDPIAALRYAHNAAAGEIRTQVFDTVEQTALLDSVLGPLFKDPRNKDLAQVVRGDLQRHVKYLVGVESAEPGPATYARAVRDISSKVAALRGTQTQSSNQAPSHPLGLGPATSGVRSESYGSDQKPIKPVSMITHSMDEWADNYARRIAQGEASRASDRAY